MIKIYGIFSGCHSDWNVHGYFSNRDLAERYCAKKNIALEDRWDDYYVVELKNIQEATEGLENIRLKYKHEVVFDYNIRKDTYRMRNEPHRYEYYIEDEVWDNDNTIESRFNGWISFKINTNSTNRDKVEKIATDMFGRFKYLIAELGDERLAIKELAMISGFKLMVNI